MTQYSSDIKYSLVPIERHSVRSACSYVSSVDMQLQQSPLTNESLHMTHLACQWYNYPCSLAEKGGWANGCTSLCGPAGSCSAQSPLTPARSPKDRIGTIWGTIVFLTKGKAWHLIVVINYSDYAHTALCKKQPITSLGSSCKLWWWDSEEVVWSKAYQDFKLSTDNR